MGQWEEMEEYEAGSSTGELRDALFELLQGKLPFFPTKLARSRHLIQ